MSSIPVQQFQNQHPQATTVSDEMSLFNSLDSDAKMARMYKFMFTNMRGLESRLNEVARSTSERFSQVDAWLQALQPQAVEKTAEKLLGLITLPRKLLFRDCQFEVSYEEIVTSIFNFIGATRYLDDVMSIRNLNSAKDNGSVSTLNGNTAVPMSLSLILRFKSVQVRNEVMRLKILKGDIPVITIFPNLPDLDGNKIFSNEFLTKEVLKLLRLVRAWAKARNYERVWVRNEEIFVRKNTDSEVISISSESDLNKLIWRQLDSSSTSSTTSTPSTDHLIVSHMNINSLRRKRDVVMKDIEEVKPLIIAISETWLDPDSHVPCTNWWLQSSKKRSRSEKQK